MSHAPKIQQRGTEAAGRRHLWCQGLQDHHGSLQDQHNCTQHLFFTVRLFFMDSSVSSVDFFVLCFFVFYFFFRLSRHCRLAFSSENLQCFAVSSLNIQIFQMSKLGKNKDSCRNCLFSHQENRTFSWTESLDVAVAQCLAHCVECTTFLDVQHLRSI